MFDAGPITITSAQLRTGGDSSSTRLLITLSDSRLGGCWPSDVAVFGVDGTTSKGFGTGATCTAVASNVMMISLSADHNIATGESHSLICLALMRALYAHSFVQPGPAS